MSSCLWGSLTRYNTLTNACSRRSTNKSSVTFTLQVQIKAQILRGLLRRYEEGKEEAEPAGAAGPAHDPKHPDKQASALRDTWKRREDLVKTGTVTPLDALDDLTVTVAGRRRRTLQDYKVAEGMTIQLPRSRRAKLKPRTVRTGDAASMHESRRELDKPLGSADEQESLHDAAKESTETHVKCPVCAQFVKVDDPTNPDPCLSTHLDRCTRSTRRGSRRPAEEDDDFEEGDGSTARGRPRKGIGLCPIKSRNT